MDVFPATFLLVAIFLGSIPAVALLIYSHSIRSRKRARMELKRHVQKREATGSM